MAHKSQLKKERQFMQEQTNLRVKCPYCEHKNVMPVQIDEKICYWCGHKIKNNTKLYFKYKLKKIREKKIIKLSTKS